MVAGTSRFWGTDMTDQQTDQPDAAAVDGYAEMQVDTLLNLAEPQPMYRDMIEQGGMASPMDGIAMVFSRELTDHVLRHHELFSSVGGIDLGNIRPLIPLNVDPPEHSKYRKILDPLFAPKRWTRRRPTSPRASTTSSTRSSIAASATSPRSSPSCSRRRCSSA